MNKVYRIVRSKIDGRLIVASEIARGAVKGKGTGMLAMTALLLLSGGACCTGTALIVPNDPGVRPQLARPTNGAPLPEQDNHSKLCRLVVQLAAWVDIKAPNCQWHLAQPIHQTLDVGGTRRDHQQRHVRFGIHTSAGHRGKYRPGRTRAWCNSWSTVTGSTVNEVVDSCKPKFFER